MIDSHAHLTSNEMYGDIDLVLQRAKQAGLDSIVNICTDKDTLQKGLELAEKYPWVHNTAATTPHDVDKAGKDFFPLVEKAAREKRLVAIGETGLDYHHMHSEKETQKEYLRKYLRLALEFHLPVVIHCRDAFPDFFEILDQEFVVNGRHAPGVLHCFTGTLDEARQVIERGWYLSLSGIVTFKKSVVLREVAEFVPLSQLLIETDSPYLAPQTVRGKRNEPAYIREVASMVAQVKHLSLDEVIQTTKQNAKKLFHI